MDEGDWLAARFQAHHTRLHAVGYRMLGSLSEADDADPAGPGSPGRPAPRFSNTFSTR
jgi:hypothetical protein